MALKKLSNWAKPIEKMFSRMLIQELDKLWDWCGIFFICIFRSLFYIVLTYQSLHKAFSCILKTFFFASQTHTHPPLHWIVQHLIAHSATISQLNRRRCWNNTLCVDIFATICTIFYSKCALVTHMPHFKREWDAEYWGSACRNFSHKITQDKLLMRLWGSD